MTNKINSQLKVLSYYQIAGGIIGVGLTIWLMISSFLWLLFLFFLIALLLYSFSIFCGIVLLKNIETGLRFSKINQLLQVIHFTAFGYAFKYISGIHLSIGLDLTESIKFQFNLSLSGWQFTFNNDDPSIIVSLNLVALLLIAFIDNIQSKIKKDQLEKQVSVIGQSK